MAAVWLGKTAIGHKRLVAIKRILPHVAEDTEFISMFIDEAKITVQLDHPNICKIYGLGQDSDYYIAMEYVHGRDLRVLFDGCAQRAMPPPIPFACYVMACCCRGLDYAHRREDEQGNGLGIVHRDVSLQNILVGFDGDVKIIDFGIAKAVNKSTKTAAGTLKGKFSYMSPEQVCGDVVDRRSDIFGIGICLYELLTGKRLFSGKTDFSVLEKVRKAEVALPTTVNGDIPSALEKIVMKALAKNVEDRYQYASDMGDDLWLFLCGLDETFTSQSLAEYMQVSFAQQYADEKRYLEECLVEPIAPEFDSKDLFFERTDEQAIPQDAATDGGAISEGVPEVSSTTGEELSPVDDTLGLEGGENMAPPVVTEGPTLFKASNERESRTSLVSFSPQVSLLKKYLWVWAVSLLAVFIAVVILVWPTSIPMGNVLLEVPKELEREKVGVLINDQEVLDKDKGPLRMWPRFFRVPAGKVRISMSAEGYEPFVVEMDVPASENSYVRLSKTLQKTQPQ